MQLPLGFPPDASPQLAGIAWGFCRGDRPATLAMLEHLGTSDDSGLTAALMTLAALPPTDQILPAWLHDTPTHPMLQALRGARLIETAWAIRSRVNAEQVSDEQFEGFFARLRDAEQGLIEVCGRYPGFGAPWALRLRTARGLQLGLSEIERRYDRLNEHHPHHFDGQNQLLQSLCPKWFGTWAKVFAFGDRVSGEAPPGTPSRGFLALVAMECLVDPDSGPPAIGPDALHRAADESVWHPAFGRNPHAGELHTAFGILDVLHGFEGRAERHFAQLDAAPNERLMGYLADHFAHRVRQLAVHSRRLP
ncbi:hypothetical protein AADG42_12610 [Ammonicoccus fulvus]|uniref:Uncharacterized protein n=1 Tax=Ammonicoccus fulvus TaxID=3138240 RepID=A0ABZ3FSE8_9ACTN